VFYKVLEDAESLFRSHISVKKSLPCDLQKNRKWDRQEDCR